MMDRQGATIGTLDASGDIADSFVERDVTKLDESSVNPAVYVVERDAAVQTAARPPTTHAAGGARPSKVGRAKRVGGPDQPN